ncbi:MAG: carboxypeptidase-like regulatory domain-containing protein, partial [Planctomycetota bacterium]
MRKPSRFPLMVLVMLVGIGSWAWFHFQAKHDVVEAGVDDGGVSHVEVLHATDAAGAGSMAVESVERKTLNAKDIADLGEHDAAVAVVHVELTLKQGEGGHPPPSCRGWEVQVKYRSGVEQSISTLSRTVDADGTVDVPFEDAVQVERISCIPPLNSGWSFAVSTPKKGTMVLPGQTHTALLNFSRAQSASGRVVDHYGEAVAQASVHVFPRKHNPGLRHWADGILSTTTDANGNFHFKQMPQGAWSFAVKPTQWLMFDPGLGDQSEGHGLLFFYGESDDATDVGTMRVVPMTIVELSLVGSQGAPAAFH